MVKRYILRAILNSKKDVFRDVQVSEDLSLTKLNKILLAVFTLDGGNMASFYFSDDSWNEGEEIPLIDFEGKGARSMENSSIQDLFPKQGSRAIWIYDFITMQAFFIETLKLTEVDLDADPLVYSFGTMPSESEDGLMANGFEEEEEDSDDEYDSNDVDDLFNEFGFDEANS